MDYVVVGAGPAGVIAAETIRAHDTEGKITMISGEDEPPYSRMAISYFLNGSIQKEGTYIRKNSDHYQKLNIDYLRNRRLVSIHPERNAISLDDGQEIAYDRLLLATGSRPLHPPIKGIDQPGIHSCWTLEDAEEILAGIDEDSHVVLIGVGFIGSIILDSIGSRKVKLTAVEAEGHMTPRMVNETGGRLLEKWCAEKGLPVHTDAKVDEIMPGKKRKLAVHLDKGEILEADLVVTATGIETVTDYLEGSGVETDEGILINEYMETNVAGIYAVGDVAQGKDFSTGGWSVHAIQPTASEHGRIAGLNMTGKKTAHQGSLAMNVISTFGLTTYSFGQWMGAEGGEHAEYLHEDSYHYIRLEFKDDLLVGAINIGSFEHIGILRGMIQNRIPLGEWKKKLQEKPQKLMDAYLVLTDFGKNIPIMTPAAG